MTWTRLDDTWTDLPELADMAHEVRWHYLCLIQFCSRTKRYDGVLKVADARRCSDVEDPTSAVATLMGAGLVITTEPGFLKVVNIDEHIPPPSVRKNSEQSRVRMRRMRKHKNGDHSECLDSCDRASGSARSEEVTEGVTRNTRTGQDGTGLDGWPELTSVSPSASSPSPEPCFECGGPISSDRHSYGLADCIDCETKRKKKAS